MKKLLSILFVCLIILICCVSCSNKSKYETAISLDSNCKFEEALEIYESLGEYESAKEKAEECKAKINISKEIEELVKNNFSSEQIEKLSSLAEKLKDYSSGNFGLLDNDLYNSAYELYTEYTKFINAQKRDSSLTQLRLNHSYIFSFDINQLINLIEKILPELENDNIKYEKVNNPEVDYVTTRLNRVGEIIRYECATTDNDPQGGLNIQYGYKGDVFFTAKKLESKYVGKSPLELDIKGGGCIEIYKTKEEALKRLQYIDYLDSVNGKAGMHVQYGTLIIWLSPELNVVNSTILLNSIKNALTE